MPYAKRGFLFKYFDKIVCGVVAALLLAGIAYTLLRAGGLPQEIRPERISAQLDRIRSRLQEPPAEIPREDIDVTQVQAAEAVPVRPNVFVWTLPVQYPAIKIGTEKEHVLQFNAPLGADTVHLERGQGLIDIIEHPVDGDFRKVRIRTKGWENVATVVGKSGDRAHIYPVVVDSTVSKTAYAPGEVAVSDQVGSVRLRFKPDERIESEEVEVDFYEVWRRDWSSPLNEYAYHATVEVAETTGREGRQPEEPTRQPAGTPSGMPSGMQEQMRRRIEAQIPEYARRGGMQRGGEEAAAAEREEGYLVWTDNEADPGQRYSYKVRTVGANTFPTRGEFSSPTDVVEVVGSVDFRFTITSETTNSVRFEVVKDFQQLGAKIEKFWVGVGDEIGGIESTAGREENYLTGAILVDFQSAAVNPETGRRSSRVIYADAEGNLRELWSKEVRAESLWEKAESGGRGGRDMPRRPMRGR